jgi:hypothetical protein
VRVSSPVGEFPFVPDRLRRDGTDITLEGHMGAWPARVVFEPGDGLRFARVAGPALAVPAAGLLVVLGLIRRRSRSSGNVS